MVDVHDWDRAFQTSLAEGENLLEFIEELFSAKGYEVSRFEDIGGDFCDLQISNEQGSKLVRILSSDAHESVGIAEVAAVALVADELGCESSILVTLAKFSRTARSEARGLAVDLWDWKVVREELHGLPMFTEKGDVSVRKLLATDLGVHLLTIMDAVYAGSPSNLALLRVEDDNTGRGLVWFWSKHGPGAAVLLYGQDEELEAPEEEIARDFMTRAVEAFDELEDIDRAGEMTAEESIEWVAGRIVDAMTEVLGLDSSNLAEPWEFKSYTKADVRQAFQRKTGELDDIKEYLISEGYLPRRD